MTAYEQNASKDKKRIHSSGTLEEIDSTKDIFADWVNGFDKKMRQQQRNVILFIDNAPA